MPCDPVTGKRRQQWVSVKGTKKDAESRLAELLYQAKTGIFVKPSKLSVANFLRLWLRDYAASNVRPRTYERYKGMVEKRLIPALGGIPFIHLQPSHLQTFYTKLLKGKPLDSRPGGLTPKTVLHHHSLLKEALSHALKWGLVSRNVAEAIDPPRQIKRRINTLDSNEVHALLEAAHNTPYYYLFHLAVYTGLRRSELLGLRWRDIDFEMAALSVVQTLHVLSGGEIVLLEPKTSKSRRLVALSPAAISELRKYREYKQGLRLLIGSVLSEDELVFSKPDGTSLHPDLVSQAFSRIARMAGLKGVRLHDLRHTHATLMLKEHIHPKIVQERLGHATIAVTLDTYSHVLPGLQEAAALQFEHGLNKSNGVNKETTKASQ